MSDELKDIRAKIEQAKQRKRKLLFSGTKVNFFLEHFRSCIVFTELLVSEQFSLRFWDQPQPQPKRNFWTGHQNFLKTCYYFQNRKRKREDTSSSSESESTSSPKSRKKKKMVFEQEFGYEVIYQKEEWYYFLNIFFHMGVRETLLKVLLHIPEIGE